MINPCARLTPVALAEKLSRAPAAYEEKVHAKLEELTALLRRGRAGDDEALDLAQQLAHQLCGTAGTFGFTEISDAMRRVEREIIALRSASDRSASWDIIATELQRVKC